MSSTTGKILSASCSAIEPIIKRLQTEGHLGCGYLKDRAGDPVNVILSVVGHNSGRILAWLRQLCCLLPHAQPGFWDHYGLTFSPQA